MRFFSAIYQRARAWSQHRHAPYYLAGASFAESALIPIAPDAMLIPMALAAPQRAWYYAFVATISSILGGIVGYVIGAFCLQFVLPLLEAWGYATAYAQVQQWFHTWGFWAVVIAGFSPIPYKLFTIGAGAMHFAFIPFVIASIIGRSVRFFAVAAAMYWGGERLEHLIHRYIDWVGWLLVAIALVGCIVWLIA